MLGVRYIFAPNCKPTALLPVRAEDIWPAAVKLPAGKFPYPYPLVAVLVG